MTKIGVVAGRMGIAVEFVDQLIGDMPIKEFDHSINFPNRYEVYFKNGDIYKAMKASETLRGLKFDKLYLHKDTVDEEFQVYIAPSLCDDHEFFRI